MYPLKPEVRYDYLTIFGLYFFYPSVVGKLRLGDINTLTDLGGYKVCDSYQSAIEWAEAQYQASEVIYKSVIGSKFTLR